jgi:hypothetical protein
MTDAHRGPPPSDGRGESRRTCAAPVSTRPGHTSASNRHGGGRSIVPAGLARRTRSCDRARPREIWRSSGSRARSYAARRRGLTPGTSTGCSPTPVGPKNIREFQANSGIPYLACCYTSPANGAADAGRRDADACVSKMPEE